MQALQTFQFPAAQERIIKPHISVGITATVPFILFQLHPQSTKIARIPHTTKQKEKATNLGIFFENNYVKVY